MKNEQTKTFEANVCCPRCKHQFKIRTSIKRTIENGPFLNAWEKLENMTSKLKRWFK